MNTQLDKGPFTALDRLGERLMPGQARRVGRGIGELTVLAGRIWITGHHNGEDRVLDAGQRLPLDRAENVVIESFEPGQPARAAWRPRAGKLQRLGVRALAGALLAALARKAAPSASRPQGCMP